MAEELDLDGFETGVIVTRIKNKSTAAKIRLRVGDKILQVNNHKISSTKTMRQVTDKPAPQWDVTILRGGRKLSVVLESE